jgi:hypothetical protein
MKANDLKNGVVLESLVENQLTKVAGCWFDRV